MKLLDVITPEEFCPNCGGSLAEEGRASRALCTSGRPDSALGASQLASCKSQGLRARDGEKSHLITHGARKVRITVGGKKIKGKKYGGPLPDYGTRKRQVSEGLEVPWSNKDTSTISAIQKTLLELGYNTEVTGKFDTQTRRSIKAFQKSVGVEETGLPNAQTIDILNQLLASSTVLQKRAGVTATAPTPTPAEKDTASTTKKLDAPASVASPKSKSTQATPVKDPNARPIIHNPVSQEELITYLFQQQKMSFTHLQGIMANMAKESSFDSGSYIPHDTDLTKNPKGSAGWWAAGPSGGLCGWHDSPEEPRFTNMMNACGGEGNWQKNWKGQIDFLISEKYTKPYLKRDFKTGKEASEWWTLHWENPADKEHEVPKRQNIISKMFM